MEFKEKILTNILNEALNETIQKVFYIYNNKKELHENIFNWIEKENSSCNVLQASPDSYEFNPYYPFINLILKKAREHTSSDFEKLLEECDIYPIHRGILMDDFSGKGISRDEEIIFEEFGYEQEQMIKGVYKLFHRLYCGEPLIFIFDSINLFPSSTFDILRKIINSCENSSIMFIFTLSENDLANSLTNREEWFQFYDSCVSTSVMLKYFSEKEGESEEKEVHRVYRNENIMSRLFNYLCIKDCSAIATYENSIPEIILDWRQKNIVEYFAEAYHFLQDYEKAIVLFKMLLDYARKNNDVITMATVYRKLGLIAYYKANHHEAKKLALQSLNLVNQTGNELQYFYTHSLLLLINFRVYYYTQEEWKSNFIENIRRGRKLGLRNNLAYWLSRFDPFDTVSQGDLVVNNILEGIEISRDIKNDFRLASAYHILAFVKESQGHGDDAYVLYKQSRDIRVKINNPIEVSYINNAIGAFLSKVSKAGEAQEYFFDALDLAIESKNFHEIAMTIGNIAINCFYTNDFYNTYRLLEFVIKIKDMADIKHLAFHTNVKIYSLVAISYILCDNPTRSFRYLAMIEAEYKSKFYSTEESIEHEMLYKLLLALLKEFEDDSEQADNYFREVESLLQKHIVMPYFNFRLPFFYYNYASFLQRSAMDARYKQVVDQGLKHSKEQGSEFYTGLFNKKIGESYQEEHIKPLQMRNINYNGIVAAVKAEVDLYNLHKALDQIDYINKFQYLIDRYQSATLLVKKALEFINGTFPSELIVFSMKKDGKWVRVEELKINREQWGLSENYSDLVEDLVTNYPEHSVISCGTKSGMSGFPCEKILHVPLGHKMGEQGHILFCSKEINDGIYTNDEIKTIVILSRYLLGAVEKIFKDQKLKETNVKLEKLASTDHLTGLLNRKAFNESIDLEYGKYKRYGHIFSLMFIDLDNFKYYNDAFGHSLGDTLLVEFKEILKKSLRSVDTIGRYGGDEFIVLLPETDIKSAGIIANRIIDTLNEKDGFKPLIFSSSSMKNFDESNRLGCSIGIAQISRENMVTIEELLIQADKALYAAKKSGKNCLRFYEE